MLKEDWVAEVFVFGEDVGWGKKWGLFIGGGGAGEITLRAPQPSTCQLANNQPNSEVALSRNSEY